MRLRLTGARGPHDPLRHGGTLAAPRARAIDRFFPSGPEPDRQRLKASAPDGQVEVIVGSSAGRVEITVLNRGESWPDVVRKHLGEPFVTTRADGVGLGLYYVYTLAQALGAELTLEDRDTGGALAQISLTAIPVASPAATSGEMEGEAALRQAEATG